MIEFLVGLVAVLAIFAGLLQILELAKVQTDTMVVARRKAGELAMLDLDPGQTLISGAAYIRDVKPGVDGEPYTPDDDLSDRADAGAFSATIVERAVPGALGSPEHNAAWQGIMGNAHEKRLSLLRGQPNPSSMFGLVQGRETKTVELIPAFRSLIYRADRIEMKSEAWMTWTKGLY
ncbi:MAG: hypothetical protein N2255_04065 [Kiritimatiellae bacterium]|nr:hypothetical protein [Kiritimatiellia bacterium]